MTTRYDAEDCIRIRGSLTTVGALLIVLAVVVLFAAIFTVGTRTLLSRMERDQEARDAARSTIIENQEKIIEAVKRLDPEALSDIQPVPPVGEK